MGIVLTFAFNTGLNLVLGLAVAAVLGPAEYGRFAIAFTLAIVLCTALFDWLRLATTRFVGGEGGSVQAVKTSLERGYVAFAIALLGLAALAQAAGQFASVAGVPTLLVAVTAVTNARFEFRAAEARALFRDGAYIRLVLTKNVLALGLMISAGLVFGSADWVIGMLALSSAVAAFLAGRQLDLRTPAVSTVHMAQLVSYARYGVPIVGANLAYQIVVLVNRGVSAKWFGLADAGSLSLATDLTIRLLLSVGAALDAYLFQLAVRRRAEGGEEAARRQVADNMLIVGGMLALLAAGYVAALPSLEALFVPAAYRGGFAELSMILVPGVVVFCFVQFGLSPIFQLSHSTAPLLWSALAGLAVDLAGLAIVPSSAGVAGFATVHTVALLAGGLVAAGLAARARGCWPSRRDVASVALLVAATAGAMWPLRSLASPWLSLAGACLAGGLVAVAVLLALDIRGVRAVVWAVLGERLGRLGFRRSAGGAPAGE